MPTAPSPRRLVAGIFVGGTSSRMGTTKGLLRAPSRDGATLVEHARSVLSAVTNEIVLVGRHDAYSAMGLPMLDDAVAGIGPLGGLVALLDYANDGCAIACACDMPYVNEALARRLVEHPPAAIVTPLAEGVLQPLFARYDAPACRDIAARRAREAASGSSRALQGLLKEVGATPLPLLPEEERWLRDWDSPADIER